MISKKQDFQLGIVNNLVTLSFMSLGFFGMSSIIFFFRRNYSSTLFKLEKLGIKLNENQIEKANSALKEINRKNNLFLKISLTIVAISIFCLVSLHFLTKKINKAEAEENQNQNGQNEKQKFLAALCLISCLSIIAAELTCLSYVASFIFNSLSCAFSSKAIFNYPNFAADLKVLQALDLPTNQSQLLKNSLKFEIAITLIFQIILLAFVSYIGARIIKKENEAMKLCLYEIKDTNQQQITIPQ